MEIVNRLSRIELDHQLFVQVGVDLTTFWQALHSAAQVLEVAHPDLIKISTNPYVRQFVDGKSVGPIKMKLKEFEAEAAAASNKKS